MTKLITTVLLLLQVICHLLITVECGSSCELPSGYKNYPGEKTALKIHIDRVTWNQARRRCLAEGADLGVDFTPRMMDDIRIIGNSLDAWIWMGIHRPSGGGRYNWVRADTGLPVESSRITTYNYKDDDDCASIFIYNKKVDVNNWDCPSKFPFACVISIAEGCTNQIGTQGSEGDTGSFDLTRSEVASLYLMAALQLLTLAALKGVDRNLGTPEPIPLFVLPKGYVAHPDIGAAYKVHLGEFVVWKEAEQLCNLEGAHLAVIDSAKKLEYATNPPLGGDVRHVGIHKVDGQWVSVTNAPISTSTIPWSRGEGTDADDAYGLQLAMVGWYSTYNGLINRGNYHFGDYVCEIPLPAAVYS